MVFVQDPSRPREPNPEATAGSDRDRRRAQEERPSNPSRPEPFSRGNTPALIAQGPLGSPGEAAVPSAPPQPPRPEPSSPRDARTPEPQPGEPPEAQGDSDLRLREGESGLAVRPPGEGDAWRERGERLRQALSQMGAGGSVGAEGGAPFRHDNPVGGLSTPTGSLSFDTKGFDWGPYARRLYWIIWSNWHARMPPAIYTGLKGQVTVHFVIQKDGRITGIEILSPSGVPAYDNAATLALEASNPLPPLPESFPKESEGVTGRFLYNMWR
jgi:TonB family protein